MALLAAMLPTNPAEAQETTISAAADEMMVYRPSTGLWYARDFTGTDRALREEVGSVGATPMVGDLNGDGHTDFITWRRSASEVYGLWSAGTVLSETLMDEQPFGSRNDIPLIGDIDGNGIDEMVVYRPWNGMWYAQGLETSNRPIWGEQWGGPDDIPLLGDVDGDGDDDLVIWRTSNGGFYARDADGTRTGAKVLGSEALGSVPMLGDINGDGADDFVVYSASTGLWSARAADGPMLAQGIDLGIEANGDIPLLGDVDGDGDDDFVIRYPGSGTWWAKNSNGTTIVRGLKFGAGEDLPFFGSVPATCNGQYADIVMAEGQQPTAAAEVIVGTVRNDVIEYTSGDLICAKPGNDTIQPWPWHNLQDKTPVTVYAGDGNDNIIGSMNDDILHGGRGSDRIEGRPGDDLLFGGSGDDRIWGGQDNDVIQGGDDNDTIDGNRGDDRILAGAGSDTVTGGHGLDKVYDDALHLSLGEARRVDQNNNDIYDDDPKEHATLLGERHLVGLDVTRTAYSTGSGTETYHLQYYSDIVIEEVDWGTEAWRRGDWS